MADVNAIENEGKTSPESVDPAMDLASITSSNPDNCHGTRCAGEAIALVQQDEEPTKQQSNGEPTQEKEVSSADGAENNAGEKEDHKEPHTDDEAESKPKTPGSPPTHHKEKPKDELTDKQRKARIEELRRKKIDDYKKKEDDRRKAVFERKKRLEQEEKAKSEALMKKLTSTSTTPPKRPASAPARRAVSFSSLHYLQKTHAVAKEIDIEGKAPRRSKETGDQSSSTAPVAKDRRRTLPGRPASAMERKRPSLTSHDAPAKTDAAGKTASRPRSAMGHSSEPKMRQSISNLPPRPASSAGHKPKLSEDRLKSLSQPKSRPSMPPPMTKPLVPVTKTREMKKATSLGNVLHKPTQERPRGPMQPGRKTQEAGDKPKPKTETHASSTAAKTKVEVQKPSSAGKPKPPSPKTTAPPKPKSESAKKPDAKPHGSHKPASVPQKSGPSNEDEAKKLLAEKRRQVKEEAERKALEEKGKAEEARKKLEEEQRIRAEELVKEQERQKQHLEELRKEAEERDRLAQEEKERKEREERELIEAQKKQRQEDIDRKAQEEVERRAKEREIKRQQEEADRLERKKRVQEILGSRLRGSPAADNSVSPTPMSPPNTEEAPGENSPPMIDTSASARDRVQRLLEKNQRKSDETPSSPEGEAITDSPEQASSPQKVTVESSMTSATVEQGTIASQEDNFELDHVIYQPESSLVEADMQALRELEQEQRANHIDTETDQHDTEAGSNDEVVKNGPTNAEGSLSNNATSEESSKKTEVDKLWNEAEQIMAAENENSNTNKSIDNKNDDKLQQGDEATSGEENRLWQIVEGRIELEECY